MPMGRQAFGFKRKLNNKMIMTKKVQYITAAGLLAAAAAHADMVLESQNFDSDPLGAKPPSAENVIPGIPTTSNAVEAQRQVLNVPDTYMAVASDLGMANGLHQPQKYELAIRLANLAFTNVYGLEAEIPAGPQFQSCRIEDGRAVISFNTFGSGLTTSDGQPPKHFGIREKGAKTFEPAQAKIEGSRVVLWNDDVKKPYDVFLGFKETDLMEINLTNTESVPAAVFWLRAPGQIHPALSNL